MRLSPKELHAIKSSVMMFDKCARVFLFGSRTNDLAKGGDIDLLIISEIINFSKKIDLLVKIKDQIGEQKIDIFIVTDKEKDKNQFYQSIAASLVEI